MAAYRCPLCGINYPTTQLFSSKCPIHDVPTNFIREEQPDEDWEPRAKSIRLRLKREEELGRPIPRIQGVEVIEDDGRLYIPQRDLIKAGLHYASNGPSFRMFELDGWIYELQGWHESARRWWIEKVAPAKDPEPEPAPAPKPEERRPLFNHPGVQ